MLVLVVDDSRSVRLLLSNAFRKNGYTVVEAANGIEAIEKAGACNPDIITMDVSMPEMDGFAACAVIRETEPGRSIPVIFITQKDSIRDREKGFQLGAADFISKLSPSPEKEAVLTANRILKCTSFFEGFTILAIDDTPLELQLIANILAQEGINVITSAGGKDALAKLGEHAQAIDLILTDYDMPEMNGAEFCRQVRGKIGMRNLPVLFVSGIEREDVILETFKAGGSDFLRKPFMKEELLARIRVHKERSAFIKELGSSLVELERLSKLRDEFVAMATHDLKSPLNTILSCSAMLTQDTGMGEQQLSLLNSITDASKTMLTLVNDVVELSRLGNPTIEEEATTVSLLPLLGLAVSGHQPLAQKKGIALDLRHNFCCDPIVDGNRNTFLRIFNNLLTNAIKFTPPEGQVAVAVDHADASIVITIEDSGIGIPPSLMPELFNGLTKNSRPGTAGEPGTGLGLAIVKKLTEQNSGRIAVRSTEGAGTSFTLTFPISQLAG